MRAFRVRRKSDGTDFHTSDFIDIWNILDGGKCGDPITVTTVEMTPAKFFEIVKKNVNGPELPGQLDVISHTYEGKME